MSLTRVPNYTTSPVPPAGALPNDLWFDTDSGFEFVYYDDGNTVQWVATNPSRGSTQGPPGPPGVPGPPGPVAPEALIAKNSLNDLKITTDRPNVLITLYRTIPGDGGGGMWTFRTGDQTANVAADPGQGEWVAPSLDPTGLFGAWQRIWFGQKSLKWFGARGDGITNDTVAVGWAIDRGGKYLVDGNFLISSVIQTIDGVFLQGVPGAKFTSIPGSTSDMIRLVGDDNRVECLTFDIQQSPGATSGLRLTGHRTRVKSIRIIGGATNFRTPQTVPGPQYGLLYQPTVVPYNALEDIELDDVYVQGCSTGIYIPGSRRAKINDITIYGTYGMGMIVGGVTTYDVQMTNFFALCCGLYGFSGTTLFWGASYVEAVPMYGWSLIGMRAENCGWMAFFGPAVDTSDVGSLKYGFDIVGNGYSGLRFIGSAKDCAAGGLEHKGGSSVTYDKATTLNLASTTGATVISVTSATNLFKGMKAVASGIPDDTYITSVTAPLVTLSRPTTADMANGTAVSFLINIQPPGNKNSVFDMEYVSHLDIGQQGAGVYQEDPTILAGTWAANCYHKIHAVTEQAPPWRSLILQRPMDIVASNGGAWICLGNNTDGREGTTGMVAPPAGANYLNTTAVGSTPAGNTVIPVNSTAGAAIGHIVYALNVPDGTTIAGVNPGVSITLSAPCTGTISSGRRFLIASRHFDGGMWWFYRGPDTSGASTGNVGMQSYGVTNYVFDVISDGNGVGARFDCTGGSDDKYLNVQCTARVRNSVTGINISGAGNFVNGTFSSCDIEASGQAFFVSATGTIDFTIDGGKFKNTGAASRQALRFIAGNSTVRVDGGAYFVGQYGLYIDGNAVVDLKFGAATLEGGASGGQPAQFLGTSSGTIDWGNVVFVNNNAGTAAGWRAVAGTITTRGRALRQDMTAVPTAATRGNVGEYMNLAVPTRGIQGYICTAANFGISSFTWVPIGVPAIDSIAPVVLPANVPIGTILTYFNGPNTGAIGAAGERWRITASFVVSQPAGNDFYQGRIFDGAGVVGNNLYVITAGAGLNTAGYLMSDVTLAGATTFTLQVQNVSTNTGQIVSGSWIAAQRLL